MTWDDAFWVVGLSLLVLLESSWVGLSRATRRLQKRQTEKNRSQNGGSPKCE